MNPSAEMVQPAKIKKKKVWFYLIYLLILAVLFVVVGEVVLRFMGVKLWRTDPRPPVQVDPGGRFFRKHPALGFTHIPGTFKVTLNSGHSFDVTHSPDTLRITHPINRDAGPKPKGEVWIFGCSFTHGWLINDEETYPWLLQERFPEYAVINYGVSGYGTIHSLLQFQEALKTKTPNVVILAYAGFHDKRNSFSRIRRKNIAHWNKLGHGPLVQPYARLDKKGGLQYLFGDVEYTEFPLMRRLVLAHAFEMKYNQLQFKWHRSREVSEALVMEMARLSEKNKVKFIVANISEGHAMLDFAEKNNLSNIDISVDSRLPENTARPGDLHPSALANRKFADKLEDFLKVELLE